MSDAYDLTPAEGAWKNRIVGHEVVDPEDLLANPFNFRIHSKLQQDAIAGLLDSVGWIRSVIVNKLTGHIVDGHARVTLALRAGEMVPVEYVELTADEEYLALVSLDYIVELAGKDEFKLDELLRKVQTTDDAIMSMLSQLAEEEGLYFENGGGPLDPGEERDAAPAISRADELAEEWGTAVGQLWRLPSRTSGQDHYLLCGDSTDPTAVERVMGGATARILITDPPYGVDYAALVASRENQKVGGWADIKGDAMTEEELRTLVSGSLELAADVAGAVVGFVWGPSGNDTAISFMLGIRDAGWRLSQSIVWVKNALVFGRADYQWRHELCLYIKREGAGRQEDRTETTVWEIPKPSGSDHPTSKPLELYARALRNHTKPADILYEPFVGSGTGIVAAENLQRQCRAIELTPGYTAVCLQRYVDAFGIRPEMVDED